jgi:hypothetical protein
MTRWIVAIWSAGFALGVLSSAGCQATHVGDPCTPEQEYDKSFLGFSKDEVSVESKSFQCQTRLCLVDHFQGRVSCPYGQAADGGTYAPLGCYTPGINQRVDGIDSTGTLVDPIKQAAVLPQCSKRTAPDAVYCSCRCANIKGQTDDGANYCKCPDGFDCTQLVASIGSTDQGLTGAYCVKHSAQYDPLASCVGATTCQTGPGAGLPNCGMAQGVP